MSFSCYICEYLAISCFKPPRKKLAMVAIIKISRYPNPATIAAWRSDMSVILFVISISFFMFLLKMCTDYCTNHNTNSNS